MKQYIYKPYKDCNAIRIDVTYDLGGMNYFSGGVEERGIYVHISPIQKAERHEVYSAFSGAKLCVFKMKRASAKALSHYEKLVADNAQQLADWFVAEENNLIYNWLKALPEPK